MIELKKVIPKKIEKIKLAWFSNNISMPTGYCYDEKTEILTKRGWKYFKDISESEIVATRNKKGELEYHKINEKIVQDYKGKMIKWKGQQYNICVTPNHRMIVERPKFWKLKNYKLMEKTAEELFLGNQNYSFIKDCVWKNGTDMKYVMIDEKKSNGKEPKLRRLNMDDFLSFMGWYLAEGYLFSGGRNYRVHISQSKSHNPEKWKEIMALINRMGFKPHFYEKKSDISFHSKVMNKFLNKFGKCDEKYVPDFIKGMKPGKIKIFLDSLFKGDGCFTTKKGKRKYVSYLSTSKKLADDVHELLIKVGLNGAVKRHEIKNYKYSFKGTKPTYSISVNHYRLRPHVTNKPEKIDYEGKIYCVNVKNNIVMVRRNGKAIWCGNSKVTKEVCSRLAKDPLFEVHLLGEGSNENGTKSWNNCTLWGVGADPNKFMENTLKIVDIIKPDVLIFLEDTFTLGNFRFPLFKFPCKVGMYCPQDGNGIPDLGVETLRNMDFIIPMSHFSKGVCEREEFTTEKVIWHGVDLNMFCPVTKEEQARLKVKFGFKPEDFILFNMGRNSARKNNQAMIQATIEFLKDKPDNVKAFFHIMNPNVKEANLYSFLSRYMTIETGKNYLGNRIIINNKGSTPSKPLSDNDVANLYKMCDVVISTSIGEGFGFLISESMACGKPIIHTDYTTPKELLETIYKPYLIGKRGLVVKPKLNIVSSYNVEHGFVDYKDFAKAMDEVYNDKKLAEELGKNGRMFAEKYFDWDELVWNHWIPTIKKNV